MSKAAEKHERRWLNRNGSDGSDRAPRGVSWGAGSVRTLIPTRSGQPLASMTAACGPKIFVTANNTAAVIIPIPYRQQQHEDFRSSGSTLHAWRELQRLSSDGVNPITVSFDFQINYGGGTSVEIDPFIYETDVMGSNGTQAEMLRRAGCRYCQRFRWLG